MRAQSPLSGRVTWWQRKESGVTSSKQCAAARLSPACPPRYWRSQSALGYSFHVPPFRFLSLAARLPLFQTIWFLTCFVSVCPPALLSIHHHLSKAWDRRELYRAIFAPSCQPVASMRQQPFLRCASIVAEEDKQQPVTKSDNHWRRSDSLFLDQGPAASCFFPAIARSFLAASALRLGYLDDVRKIVRNCEAGTSTVGT